MTGCDEPRVVLPPLGPIDPVLVWLLRDSESREPVITLDSPVIAELLGNRATPAGR